MVKKDQNGGTATLTAQQAVLEVQAFAARVAQEQKVYRDTEGTIGPGRPANLTGGFTPNVDVLPQGDLYLMSVDEKMFKVSADGKTATASFSRNRNGSSEPVTMNYAQCPIVQAQLVPGHLAGAKHCLQDITAVETMWTPVGWSPLMLFGPVFQLKQGRTGVIEHPSHGYINIDAGLLVFCYYQRNEAQESRDERRAAD